MVIAYNWTCSACGNANAAGSDVCAKCGINAVTSAEDIERHKQGAVAPTAQAPAMRQPHRFLAAGAGLVAIAGAVLERFTFPTMALWYVSLVLMAGGVLALWAVLTWHKRQTT